MCVLFSCLWCPHLQHLIDTTGLLDIDFFSLDVEGAELYVLQTVDFSVTNIHYILMETDNPNSVASEALLTAAGFVRHALNMKDGCIPNHDCAVNTLFVNSRYEARHRGAPQLYQYGTAMKCP